jgi:dihydroxy-acid dehydratase
MGRRCSTCVFGGPIALIEDGDTIVVDINKDRLDCQELDDAAVYTKRSKAWQEAATQNGGVHPKVNPITNRLLKRMRASARPALQGGGMAVE